MHQAGAGAAGVAGPDSTGKRPNTQTPTQTRNRRWAWPLSAYAMVTGLGAREAVAYRLNFLIGVLYIFVQVFLLASVWRAVYADRAVVDGVALSTVLAYVTLITVQNWLVSLGFDSHLPQRIHTGEIAFDISRPLGLMGQLYPRQFGRTLVMLPFALVALPVSALVSGMQGPVSPTGGGLYAVSLVLAYLIATLLTTLIGLTAFWTLQTRGIRFMCNSAQRFLSGALVPLWFMPDWLRTVCEILPFQAMAYTPVSIYLGRIAGDDTLSALGLQAGWVVALALVALAVYRQGVRRVVIQGG